MNRSRLAPLKLLSRFLQENISTTRAVARLSHPTSPSENQSLLLLLFLNMIRMRSSGTRGRVSIVFAWTRILLYRIIILLLRRPTRRRFNESGCYGAHVNSTVNASQDFRYFRIIHTRAYTDYVKKNISMRIYACVTIWICVCKARSDIRFDVPKVFTWNSRKANFSRRQSFLYEAAEFQRQEELARKTMRTRERLSRRVARQMRISAAKRYFLID